MKPLRFVLPTLALILAASLAVVASFTRESWLPWFQDIRPSEGGETPGTVDTPVTKVLVSEQAQKNLGLTARPLRVGTYWKTIMIPGMVADRPGLSDRGVVSPVTAVVSAIHHVPGDTVRPGEMLFTLRLLSESLHLTQTELFKASQDIKLVQAQRKLLAAAGDAIAQARIIEVENQITRLQVASKAYRQELFNRGLSPNDMDAVAEGRFVREIPVVVPSRTPGQKPLPVALVSKAGSSGKPPSFELQELKVELGQHVRAGQTLCLLANHQLLVVEGRAFRDETPLLERSVREKWPVEVDFQEDAAACWPTLDQTAFRIHHLANTIDPIKWTFAFRVPLENQSRVVEQDGRTQILWRFRPGQKVRVLVRIEKLDNVFILPADAVTREGPEAFVFTQNVNTFERKSVLLLWHERRHAVLANDGSLLPGMFVVQNVAAQLNRMVKAGSGSGVPKGYHIHADGSLHKNEDEGK